MDNISVPSYAPSVNPHRPPIEKQVGDIQGEIWTKLEQFKALENNIRSRNNMVYEAAQLQELYIIKFKRDICMLQTKVN